MLCTGACNRLGRLILVGFCDCFRLVSADCVQSTRKGKTAQKQAIKQPFWRFLAPQSGVECQPTRHPRATRVAHNQMGLQGSVQGWFAILFHSNAMWALVGTLLMMPLLAHSPPHLLRLAIRSSFKESPTLTEVDKESPFSISRLICSQVIHFLTQIVLLM